MDTLKGAPNWIHILWLVVTTYLSVTEFAELAGLSRNTVKAYAKIPGRIPEPDAMVGRVRGWLPETVDAWVAKRSSS